MNAFLTQFLESPQRPEGTLHYHEVQGFLFAIVSAPELIPPSEWLPLIFNEQEADYDSLDEAQTIMHALMGLYNDINTQVLDGEARLPADVELHSSALDNVGETTALGQWSRGFYLGHNWLIKLWDHYTPDALDEDLGSSLMVLSFFSSRKLAEAYYQEIARSSSQSLDEFAETMQGMFEDAMRSYAHLGRSIYAAIAAQAQQPYVSEKKPGRNDPCPCGSGRKYKHCCLH